MWCWISDFEYIPIDCKSIFGLRAIALMLSGENFLSDCINVGYGVCMFLEKTGLFSNLSLRRLFGTL